MLTFIPRAFPSANQVLLHGTKPILVDSGFGSDFPETVTILTEQGMDPQALQMVVNTHWHCDHSGGNHHFQREYGLQIATHKIEAEIINRGLPEAHDAHWLVQPIEACTIDLSLQE
ncbi:MAG: MBL fold metallo-hydrolase, partial [Anaerolineae bacterium]|nr:MBL fold metallo-hydrolase [Anaerolineae bacterium]